MIMLRAVFALSLLFPTAVVLGADAVVTTDRFELRNDARVNLHHLLVAWAAADAGAWPPYAPSIAERGSWRVLLDEEDRRAWSTAVGAYAATVNRTAIFDAGLIALRDLAAGVGSPDAVPAADRPLIGALEAALPIYERHWWRAHDAQNRAWVEAVAGVLAKTENDIARRVENAYGGRWPDAPVPVDVVLYAGALGAYSTGGRITIGSADVGYRMPQALEMLFHEASHVSSLESPLAAGIEAAFRARGGEAPERFWHDMIFFTAGTATRVVLAERGQPGYRHYGELGVYLRGERWQAQLPLLEQHWRPFVESGSGDAVERARALEAIAEALP
jgi:hypothetical protein